MRHLATYAPLLALLLAPLLATAADAPVTRLAEIPIHFKAKDLSKVETASLWVTTNGGATWNKVASETVAADATKGPTFAYAPSEDGRYGFATRAEYRDGSADAMPMTGEPPKAGHVVVVDRSAPLIEQYEVVVGDQDPGLITVRWRVGDANPRTKPVQLAMAPRKGGDWIPFGEPQQASGSWTGPFPTADFQLRLEARDRAGNRSASDPWQAPAPAPTATSAQPAATPDPEVEADPEVDVAVAAMPAATDDPPGAAQTDPALTEAISGLPDPEALEEEVPAEPQPTFVDSPPPAPAQPTATTQPAASKGPMSVDELIPLPRIPAPTGAERDPSAVLSGLGRVVLADEAPRVLDTARAAARDGDTSTARALYRRLGDSPLTATALIEEVLLLAHSARSDAALALADSAPAEARSDALFALHARLLLRAGDFEAARRPIAAISAKGERAREGMWLGALAARAMGEAEAAAPVLQHLASGSDTWAQLARELLRRG